MRKYKVSFMVDGNTESVEIEAKNLEDVLTSTDCPSDPALIYAIEEVVEDPKLGLDDWFEDVQEGLDGITTAAEKIAAKVTELSEEQTELLAKIDPEFLPKLSGAVEGLGEGLEEHDMRMTDIAIELDELE